MALCLFHRYDSLFFAFQLFMSSSKGLDIIRYTFLIVFFVYLAHPSASADLWETHALHIILLVFDRRGDNGCFDSALLQYLGLSYASSHVKAPEVFLLGILSQLDLLGYPILLNHFQFLSLALFLSLVVHGQMFAEWPQVIVQSIEGRHNTSDRYEEEKQQSEDHAEYFDVNLFHLWIKFNYYSPTEN